MPGFWLPACLFQGSVRLSFLRGSVARNFHNSVPARLLAYYIGLRVFSTVLSDCSGGDTRLGQVFNRRAKSTCLSGAGMEEVTSIHSDHIEEVHEIPMNVLIRPFPSELDEKKVHSLMETLESSERGNVPPVDIMWVKGRLGGDYFYSFGGCHRHEAHKRLKRETIKARLVKTNIATIKTYLGGSMPDLK